MIILAVAWFLGFLMCVTIVVFACKRGLSATYRSGKVANFWSDFPFGAGYPVAPGIAGFSVFPIINLIIGVAVVLWSVERMNRDGLTLSMIFGDA